MLVIVKTLIFTALVPATVTVVIPYLLVNSRANIPFDIGGFRFTGILLIAPGAASYLWSAAAFALSGKGTPAPIGPPKLLVSRGLYRLCRNPMYLGVVMVLAGEGILFMSLLLLAYAAFQLLFFHLFAVFYEEPHLKRKFGQPYEEYMRRVPRWIPAIRRPKANGKSPEDTNE